MSGSGYEGDGQRSRSKPGYLLVFGPNATTFFGDTGIELDLTLGGGYLHNDVKVIEYDGTETVTEHDRVSQLGFAYAVAASYSLTLKGTRVGPYVQWQHAFTGDVLPSMGGENSSISKTFGIHAGIQIWY